MINIKYAIVIKDNLPINFLMEQYELVLIIDNTVGTFLIHKNRFGPQNIHLPISLLVKVIENPNGKIKFDWE